MAGKDDGINVGTGTSEGRGYCPRTRYTKGRYTPPSPRGAIHFDTGTPFQVPYELLNRKFRGIQKIYDRDITSASNTSGELASCALKPTGATVQEICGVLDGVGQKISSLKRKAEESTEEEIDCTRLCKARLDHLKSYASGMLHICGYRPFEGGKGHIMTLNEVGYRMENFKG